MTTDGPDFVPPAERIATFDNDGTLWVEQPLPPQFDFVFGKWAEEIKADPSLAAQAALQGDHRKGPGLLRWYCEPGPRDRGNALKALLGLGLGPPPRSSTPRCVCG